LLSLISFGSIGYATLIKCIMPPLSQLLLLDFLLITHSFVRSCYNKRLPISTYDQFRYKTTNIKSLNWTMIVKIANQRWGLVSPFVRITVITIPKEPFDDDPCIEDIQVPSKVLNEFQSNTSFMSSTIFSSPDY
jgi:hypothetical protein